LENFLPPIPAKRYFTIGEVSELCGVKPHVLRYWEQEFSQLRPMKRRGNRRYYQHHEVLMIRRIRALLYDQGFTISGARNKLVDMAPAQRDVRANDNEAADDFASDGRSSSSDLPRTSVFVASVGAPNEAPNEAINGLNAGIDPGPNEHDFQDSLLSDFDFDNIEALADARLQQVRRELFEIRQLLSLV
jgi:DNA-binding transcriptional MerR regulator